MLAKQSQVVVRSADSPPAAAAPGWVLSVYVLVSAGWPAGLSCQNPKPGMETSTSPAAVRVSWESKADLYNDVTETGQHIQPH